MIAINQVLCHGPARDKLEFLGKAFCYTWPEGLTLWSLSLPQLAATLAAAVTAYTPVDANGARLIDETVINAVIVLMTVTAILGPLFTQRFGQRATPPPTGGDDAPQKEES